MTHYFDPKDSAKQVRKFAGQVYRRFQAAGAKTMQFEDIEQELWLIWCKCCETYNSQQGASFSTYLHMGMRLYINSWARVNLDRRHAEAVALSFDLERVGTDGGTLADVIPSADPSAEELVHEKLALKAVTNRLSPRARQFVQILESQPQELLDEVMHLEQKAEYAKRERGITVNLNHRLTYIMIFDLMDAGRPERKQILDEINAVAEICNR